MDPVTGGKISPDKKSISEENQVFINNILNDLASTFEFDNFINVLILILENVSLCSKEFEIAAIQHMALLSLPAPDRIIKFLFGAIEDGTLRDESDVAAFETLAILIDKKDTNKLISTIAVYLHNNNSDSDLDEIISTLKDLTSSHI